MHAITLYGFALYLYGVKKTSARNKQGDSRRRIGGEKPQQMLWCCVALLECNAELKEFSELLKTLVHCCYSEEELLQCIDSIALSLFVNVRLQCGCRVLAPV